MNWELAIEKNHGALRRILAMLVAMVAAANGGAEGQSSAGGQFTFFPPKGSDASRPEHWRKKVNCPRHLLATTPSDPNLTPPSPPLRAPSVAPGGSRDTPADHHRRARVDGERCRSCVRASRRRRSRRSIARTATAPGWLSGPARCRNGRKELMPKRSPSLSLPLLDPLKRFGVRRRYAKPSAMPQIRVLGGDPIVPLFRQPEPPAPPPPSPDDPLDAARIHRRLDAIGRALDDLPKQAQRMARWHARRDARWARERGEAEHAGQSLVEDAPSPSRPSGSPPLPHCMGARNTQAGAPASPPRIPRPHEMGERWRGRSPRRRGGKLGGAGRDAGGACALSPGKGPTRAIKHRRRAGKTPPVPPRLPDAARPSAGLAQKAEPRGLRGAERAARPGRLGTRAPTRHEEIAARMSRLASHGGMLPHRAARDRAGPYPSGRTALGVTRVPRDYQPNYPLLHSGIRVALLLSLSKDRRTKGTIKGQTEMKFGAWRRFRVS